MKYHINKIVDYLISAKMLNLFMPLLMVYLVLGTVAQKSMGLYQATELFFFAPFVWVFGVPLPGVPIVLGVMLFSLTGQVLLRSPWRKNKLGILLAHLGVLFLLGGSFFSLAFVKEGAIALAPGQNTTVYEDYHQRIVTLTDETGAVLAQVPFEAFLKAPNQVQFPFPFAVLEACKNCNITKRVAADNSLYFGMAQHMQLSAKALDPVNEKNLSGLAIEVPQPEGEQYVYLVVEGVPVLPNIDVGDKTYQLQLSKAIHPLPFGVELVSFEREFYPGTTKAKGYQSHVKIHDGPTTWEGLIRMNDPLRYKGYALFQSSFSQSMNDGEEAVESILAVVYNPYRLWPYLATGLIALGLMLHLFLGRRKKTTQKPTKKLAAAVFLAVSFMSPQAHAATLNMADFAKLPVLDEGRIKPLQSFANTTIAGLSGSSASAVEVLAAIMFAPQQAAQLPLLKIGNTHVADALGLPPQKSKHYSFTDVQAQLAAKRDMLEPLLAMEQKALTTQQAELVQVYQKAQTLAQLLSSLTALMPLDVQLNGQEDFKTYAQWQPQLASIQKQMQDLVKRKGSALENYTLDEQALAMLSFTLVRLQSEGMHANLLKIIPTLGAGYSAPWDIVNQSRGTPRTAIYFAHWQNLAKAYNTQDPALWQQTLDQLNALNPPSRLIELEMAHNFLQPVKTSLVLYGLSFLALLFLAVFGYKVFGKLAVTLLGLGAGVHFAGLAMRIAILQRPPVGTLYESILFVGVVFVGYALWRFARTRDVLWLWVPAIGGLLLQSLAQTIPHNGDNMAMLVAVLNTNFWLLVHVLTITAGYGFCLIVSGLAHVCFASEKAEDKYRPALRQAVRLALLFTFVGTLLGGVWADQSWGRFWGWDPKENGALLIVLWLIWLLHGEVARVLPWRFVLGGHVLLSGVVAVSWLGVNLLNVGLHSYGFTSAMAGALVGIWVVEIAFLALATLLRKKSV